MTTNELHVISTGQQCAQTFVSIIQHIHPYIDYIHLREKEWSAAELILAVEALYEHGVSREKVIINDRVDVAQVTHVNGVQLAYHSLDVATVRQTFPHLSIGRSVHHVNDAKQAERDGAHRLLYGHIFPTASKRGVKPRGIINLQRVVGAVNIPVIAIGGMSPERIPSVLQTGAAGIAVLSGILLADDPLTRAKLYREALDRV